MCPVRRLFTSLPTSMMPHSSVSRTSYSCRAERFWLITRSLSCSRSVVGFCLPLSCGRVGPSLTTIASLPGACTGGDSCGADEILTILAGRSIFYPCASLVRVARKPTGGYASSFYSLAKRDSSRGGGRASVAGTSFPCERLDDVNTDSRRSSVGSLFAGAGRLSARLGRFRHVPGSAAATGL